jgi:hypothetical protein
MIYGLLKDGDSLRKDGFLPELTALTNKGFLLI